MNEAGDRRETGRRWEAAESQPISMTERALVARIYALFDCFYDQLSEEHEQMRRARMLRARATASCQPARLRARSSSLI